MTDALQGAQRSSRSEGFRARVPKWTSRPVLLVLLAWNRPTYALRRAQALAQKLEADIHLLRFLPRRLADLGLFRRRNLFEALRRLERESRVADDLRDWCEASRLAAPPSWRVPVRTGDPEQQTIQLAAELEAQLIVLPASQASKGRQVARLCRKSATPVLVVRELAAQRTIVAGTNLEDDPLAEFVSDFAGTLGAPVVFVHNLDPGSARSRRNTRIRLEVPGQWGTIVMSTVGSAAQALLAEARLRQADLVVVGTCTRPEGRLHGKTAETIVQTADSSVLVAPVLDPA